MGGLTWDGVCMCVPKDERRNADDEIRYHNHIDDSTLLQLIHLRLFPLYTGTHTRAPPVPLCLFSVIFVHESVICRCSTNQRNASCAVLCQVLKETEAAKANGAVPTPAPAAAPKPTSPPVKNSGHNSSARGGAVSSQKDRKPSSAPEGAWGKEKLPPLPDNA